MRPLPDDLLAALERLIKGTHTRMTWLPCIGRMGGLSQIRPFQQARQGDYRRGIWD